MTFVLRFKTGYELPVHCEEADVQIDPASGNLEGIDFRGVVNNMPVYFNPEDILCVYKLIDGENKIGGGQTNIAHI